VLATALALAAPVAALADPPSPDPTTAPAYSPTPGTVPPSAVVPAQTTSSKLALLSGRRLVLNARKLRTTLEVRCRSSAKGHCNATGQLFVTRHGRRIQIGAWAGDIPGQVIAAPTFKLTTAVRKLPRGRAIHAALRLTNAAHTARATGTQPITTVVTLPVTIIVPPLIPAPGVTTGPASGITPPDMTGGGGGPGNAVAAGIIDPNGSPTTYHFEFGLAPGDYTRSVPATDASVPGDGLDHLVTASLTPLQAGLPTHYRLVASNTGGTTFGSDQQLTVPLVNPPPGGAPAGDATIAGVVVPQILGNQCVSSLGVMIRGADLTCTITAFNPQPPIFVAGVQQFGVRPAFEVFAVQAPAGMIGNQTHSPMEPLPLTIPPSTAMTGTVSFQILHPPVLGLPEIVQAISAPPSMATMPSFAHSNVSASLDCTAPKQAVRGSEVTCTATVRNGGTDNADLSSFELITSPNLVGVATGTVDPPAILKGSLSGGGAPVNVAERFQVSGTAKPGDAISVTLKVIGRDETDREPFQKTASDTGLTVGG